MIAQGIAKQVRIKRQTVKGTLAGTTGGQIVRRSSAGFILKKATTDTSNEMTSSRQLLSVRHGARSVDGRLAGNLSPATYTDILGALLMRDFTAVPAIIGASITIAGTGPYTLTRAAGSYLTDGVKIGHLVQLTAGAFAAGNLNKNLLVVGLTATVATVIALNRHTLVAEGPIAAATFLVKGKQSFVPTTGHTNIYYTVEEYNSDQATCRVSSDVKFVSAALSFPGEGNVSIDFTAMGLDQTKPAAPYFTAPAVETTTDTLVAAGGALLVGGVAQAGITDFSMTMDSGGAMADASVGRDVRLDIFTSKLKVTGSYTAYWEDEVMADNFLNEVRTSLILAATAGTIPNAEGMVFTLSNMDTQGADPDDTETGLKRSYTFTGVFNAAGGAALATTPTTIVIQDTAAP